MKGRFRLGLMALGVVLAAFVFAAVGCGGSDVPVELPGYHHTNHEDYKWEVVVDPEDENWTFWSDTEPTFSPSSTNTGDAQTVVCIMNAREDKVGDEDRFYTGDESYCVGGEGKIKIIPQGTRIK